MGGRPLVPVAEPRRPTARRRAYLPAAVVGNGSLLVTLSERGEVERMFWPSVDHAQHVGEFRLGLGDGDTILWLDEKPWRWQQEYLDGASIVRTRAAGEGWEIVITDLVPPEQAVLLRHVRCRPPRAAPTLVVACRPSVDGSGSPGGAFVEPRTGALVFYRRGAALAVAVVAGGRNAPPAQGEIRSLRSGGKDRQDRTVAHRAPVQGVLKAALEGEALVVAAFARTPTAALALVAEQAGGSFQAALRQRRRYDRRSLALARPPTARLPGVGELYRRSLLTLELLTDRRSGATIAAPEFDPSFLHSGGYGFVWPRDLAYVVLSFLAAGRGDMAASALRWLARHQAPEGLWLQRYWTDGSLAPAWSLHQIDETGAVLFAYDAAWRELGDEELDRDLWPSARAAAEFLCHFLDPKTGLPLPSVDLWEERDGQHAYSAAAVYGGLAAAAAMASRHEPRLASRYAGAAARVRAGIEQELWSEERGRYLRSRWVGRPDQDGRPVPAIFERDLPYPSRAAGSADPEDPRLDSSLLGLAWPFRAVDPRSPRMRATVEALTTALVLPDGGVLRYQGDGYAGGNPWILVTLWLGLYYRQVGERARWRRCVEYALARATPLGLLPEQVTRDGRPAWVLPLAWSHALFILAVRPELAIVLQGPEAGLSGKERVRAPVRP